MRQIKSYVKRQGRITTGQEEALTKLMPIHAINYQPSKINLDAAFGRNAPKIIEIGFGMGHATWQIAKEHPENDYLGLEVHSPGVGSLLMQMNDNDVHNIKVIKHDAVEVLDHMIEDNTVFGFHIFFPDPWHKKKHHKRRIIQTHFVELLSQKLKLGGYIHIATDWEDYAIWISNILQNSSHLKAESFVSSNRPTTKFEKRGLGLGHKIHDFYFIKII